MGFTTFSTQNNIYYDLETITVYLLGNLLLTYVFSLVICAAIEPLVDKCTHGSDCNTHMSEVWTKWPAAGEAIDKCNRTHYMRYGA